MNADVPTLMLMVIVSSVVMAASLLMLGWGRHQDGLQYWAASLLVSAMGYVLFLLRGRIPDVLSIVLGNTLMGLATAGLLTAVCRFHGQRPPWVAMLATVGTMAALLVLFQDSFAHRVAVTAFMLAAQMLWALWALHRYSTGPMGRGAQLLALGLALEALVLLARGLSALTARMPESHILQGNLIQTLTFMVAFIALLITSMGFVFMAKDRADAVNHQLATQDALTGAANRRSIMASLEQLLGKAQRSPAPLAVAMLDLDHFKQVNDQYGHLAGDQVLCHVVDVLHRYLRPQDALGRYGGEEFMLLLPDTPPAQALEHTQALCEAVQANPCLWQDDVIMPTISIGLWCGMVGPQATDPDVLLDAADSALYQAKQNGRNRVELAR